MGSSCETSSSSSSSGCSRGGGSSPLGLVRVPLQVPWEDLSPAVASEWRHVLYKWSSSQQGQQYQLPSILPLRGGGTAAEEDQLGSLRSLFVLPEDLSSSSSSSSLPEKTAGGGPAGELWLSGNELESLRHRGVYVCPSSGVECGVVGVKGRDVLWGEFLSRVAVGLRFVSVYAGGDLLRGKWGLVRGVVDGVLAGVVDGVDLLVGVVRRGGGGGGASSSVEEKVQHERCKFVVAELMCKREEAREVGRYVRSEVERAKRERVMRVDDGVGVVAVPYSFFTPQGQVIDLRLFDRRVIRGVWPVLTGLLERANRLTEGWFLGFREQVIRELRAREESGGGGGVDDDSVELIGFEGNRLVMDEYLRRLYAAIRACPEISSGAAAVSGLDRLLIEQAQLYVLMRRSLDVVELGWIRRRRLLLKELVGCHSLLSRDGVWLSRRLDEVGRAAYYVENRFLAHSTGIELCRAGGLQQSAYFLQRDLTFLRDSADLLRRELNRDAARKPKRVWVWSSRTGGGSSNVKQSGNGNGGKGGLTTSTSYPLWRCVNFVVRSVVFLVMVVRWGGGVVFDSEESVFAVGRVGGVVRSKVTQAWRQVSKRCSSNNNNRRTTTMMGRGSGSSGAALLLGKVWVWLWWGVGPTLVWGCGFPLVTLGVWTFAAVAAIGAPIWGPLLSLGYWVWCVAVYDFDSPWANLKGSSQGEGQQNSLMGRGGHRRHQMFPLLSVVVRVVGGAVQAGLAAVAIAACPFVTLIVVAYAFVRWAGRVAFEWALFALCEGVKRSRGGSGGGGLISFRRRRRRSQKKNGEEEEDLIYEICGLQGLLSYVGRLEGELLGVWGVSELSLLMDPVEKYELFCGRVLGGWGCVLSESVEGPYRELVSETVVLRESLESRLRARRAEMAVEGQLGGVNVRSRVRMRREELRRVLAAAVAVTRRVLMGGGRGEEHHRRQGGGGNSFGGGVAEGSLFGGRGLEEGDWSGLVTCLLCEVFSQDVLIPLEEELGAAAAAAAGVGGVSSRSRRRGNNHIKLQGEEYSLSSSVLRVVPIEMCVDESVLRFGERLLKEGEEELLLLDSSSSSSPLPLMLSKVPYRLHSPYLPLEAFNPAAHTAAFCHDMLSVVGGVGLTVPAPILHPVWISVIICGRDKEGCGGDLFGAAGACDPVSRAILRAIEEAGPAVNQQCVSLMSQRNRRGSGSSSSSGSGSGSSSSGRSEENGGVSGAGVVERSSAVSLASPEEGEDDDDDELLGGVVVPSSYLLGTSV